MGPEQLQQHTTTGARNQEPGTTRHTFTYANQSSRVEPKPSPSRSRRRDEFGLSLAHRKIPLLSAIYMYVRHIPLGFQSLLKL